MSRPLSPDVPALAPRKNTLAYLVCVQLQAYLEDPAFDFDLHIGARFGEQLAGAVGHVQPQIARRLDQ